MTGKQQKNESSDNMIYAEILAGGNGSRMNNTKLPKQFLMLNGKPIIIYSLEQFLKNNKIDKIIIVCIANHTEHLKEIINKYIKDSSKIDIVEGGSTRNESVMNGCNYILDKYGLNDDDVIMIHDSVRPFITQKIINDNIDNVLKYGAVGTAIPVTDTIFESIDNKKVSNIPNRNKMFQAQSPQSFNIKKLMKLYNETSDKEKQEKTDSCKIFTLHNEMVKLVEGDITNIKITFVRDLDTAKGIMNSENYTGDAGTLPYRIKKKTKIIIKKTDWLSLITLIGIIMSFLILDVGIRFFSRKPINFFPTMRLSPLLFSLSYIMIIILIIYKLPKKTSSIFYGFIYLFFWFFTLSQVIHFKILNKFFTVNDLMLAGEANQNLNFVLGYFGKMTILFFVTTLIIGIINILLIRKSHGFYKTFKKRTYLVLMITLVLITRFSALSLLGKPVSEFEWDAWNYPRNVYNTYANSNRSLRVSGIYEYFFRDIYLNVNKKLFSDRKELIKLVEDNNSERLKANIEEQNKLNAIFEDKNLIMIMLESIDSWLVNDEVMPTLSSLQKNGWNFKNRYAPAFGSGATINTEFSSITGLHTPIQGNASYNYSRNLFPFSLPNLLKNKGYSANSIHFNYGAFYNRTNLHKVLGFDNHYSLIDMEFSSETMDDRELITNDDIYKLIVPSKNQKFMSFITTFSAHGPYDETNTLCSKIFQENKKLLVGNDKELTCIKELSKITDEFLQTLIKRLEEDKLIDNTVLVIFTDHYAYGYSKVHEVKNIYDTNLIQNVPFIIWHNNIDSKDVDTIIDSSDITPTLANLFGLNFDKKHYVGTDAFSNNHDNFIYFPDYSWYDGNIYYKGGHISSYDNQEYVKETSIKVNKKIELNDAILNSDYYRYLTKDTFK